MTRLLTILLLCLAALLTGCRINSSGWPVIWFMHNGSSQRATPMTVQQRDTNYFHWPVKEVGRYTIAPVTEPARIVSKSAVAPADEDGPQAYPRTVAWSPVWNADSYTLRADAFLIITTNTVAVAPLLDGTNHLTVTASNGVGTSAPARTNYVILPANIVSFQILCSYDLTTWTRTNLPTTAQTNPTGPALHFRFDPIVAKLDERHVP